LLRVGEGGFEFVGCTKRDLQNYHRDMRSTFKDSDAQMFIDNLRKRKEINPGFFFDYALDDKNRLTHVFLGEILRTTSRSESANSFFNHFIGYKHALVEFWIRIGTALEEQRQNELKADHECLNSTPSLLTS
jgi:hypothetical protein